METIKKYWFLAVPIGAFAVWLITINSRIFESPEQKVEVTNFVKNSPSAEQQQRARLLDSFNNQHAIKTRQKRYDDGVKNDSIKRRGDSLILDYVQKNAEQIYQIREDVEKLKTNN